MPPKQHFRTEQLVKKARYFFEKEPEDSTTFNPSDPCNFRYLCIACTNRFRLRIHQNSRTHNFTQIETIPICYPSKDGYYVPLPSQEKARKRKKKKKTKPPTFGNPYNINGLSSSQLSGLPYWKIHKPVQFDWTVAIDCSQDKEAVSLPCGPTVPAMAEKEENKVGESMDIDEPLPTPPPIPFEPTSTSSTSQAPPNSTKVFHYRIRSFQANDLYDLKRLDDKMTVQLMGPSADPYGWVYLHHKTNLYRTKTVHWRTLTCVQITLDEMGEEIESNPIAFVMYKKCKASSLVPFSFSFLFSLTVGLHRPYICGVILDSRR